MEWPTDTPSTFHEANVLIAWMFLSALALILFIALLACAVDYLSERLRKK